MVAEYATLNTGFSTITVTVADTPVDWSIDAAPGLTLVVPDPHRKLVLDPGTLGDSETDLIATVWGRQWPVTSAERGERAVTLTLAHRGVAGMKSLRGTITAGDDVKRPAFASLLWSKSRAGREGDALYCPLVNPEASGYRPPVLTGTAPSTDRKVQVKRDTALAPGFKAGATIKVNGKHATAEQRRVLAAALSVADDLKAPRLATIAMLAALIIESGARNLTYGDRDSQGALQVRVGIHGAATASSVERSCRKFLTTGFTGAGGAITIARRNPAMLSGTIAQMVQGSAFPARYQTVVPQARAILAAWTGDGSGDLKTATEAPEAFSLGKDEDAWAKFTSLATESGRRAYATLDALYWVTDNQQVQSRPLLEVFRGAPGVKSLGPWTVDALRQVDTLPLELVCTDAQAWQLAGHTVVVSGEGVASGVWLVAKWSRGSRRDRHASFELQRPRSFIPESKLRTASASLPKSAAAKRAGSTANARGARSGLESVRPTGQWAGTKSVFDQFIHPFMRREGLSPGSQKRATQNTASGNLSDHWSGSTSSYACDYPTNSGEAAASKLAQAFGFTTWQPNSYVGKTVRVGGKSFRLQILWGAAIDHGDHVHVGLRAV